MNLNPRRSREEPEVNITPLIDVLFLMLIFIMISATFVNQADLNITLPEATQQPVPDQNEPINIAISPEGTFSVNGERLPNTQVGTIGAALKELLGDRSAEDVPVIIRADGSTDHERVVTAMDAAQQVGFRRVGIATVPRDGE